MLVHIRFHAVFSKRMSRSKSYFFLFFPEVIKLILLCYALKVTYLYIIYSSSVHITLDVYDLRTEFHWYLDNIILVSIIHIIFFLVDAEHRWRASRHFTKFEILKYYFSSIVILTHAYAQDHITHIMFNTTHTITLSDRHKTQWLVARKKCKMFLLLLSECQTSRDSSLINRTYTHTIT